MSRLNTDAIEQLPAGTIVWGWLHPSRGSLLTTIAPDGTVAEWRQHPKDVVPSENAVGAATGDYARIAAAYDALAAGEAATSLEAVGQEAWVTTRKGADGKLVWQAIAVAATTQERAWQDLRGVALAARAHAEGGRFAWRSLAGRLFWLCVPLALLLLGMLVFDASSTSRVLRDGVHVQATVVAREGKSAHDDKKALLVSMPALFATSPSTARITEYLSAEQWEQAVPGQDVRVVYRDVAAASRNEVFVEADLQRFQRQKGFALALPLVLVSIALAVLVFWPRYRIGRHDDGQEYIVDGDRVVSDDKDMPVSRLTINIARVLWRVLH
jgi:hypothetical protein